MTTSWLALVVGNTRLHWGYFEQGELSAAWHTDHLTKAAVDQVSAQPYPRSSWLLIDGLVNGSPNGLVNGPVNGLVNEQRPSLRIQDRSSLELWLASVVPEQTWLWQQTVPEIRVVERSHIPLQNIYPTLGIDRAVNLLGAKQAPGFPALVIDGGTALTLTAGADDSVYGGAILPGLKLQLESLGQQTAALKSLLPTELVTAKATRELPTGSAQKLPERWARDSAGAIASGIAYSLTSTCIDYITDWWRQFPAGTVVLTGGDAPLLYQYLQQRTPAIASRVLVDSNLMFRGMQAYRSELTI